MTSDMGIGLAADFSAELRRSARWGTLRTPRRQQLRLGDRFWPACAPECPHPQRLCHDHGAGRGRSARWRRACRERGDRRYRHEAWGCSRRGNLRRARLHRDARPDRYPLAYVDHALAQHGGKRSRPRLFPDDNRALGKVYTPRDMYYGTLLACAEALHSGITTVHNWCHNNMSYEHAAEDLRAMRETGLRGRFSYGPARSTPITQPFSVEGLERMHGDWASLSNEGLLTLGIAWRGVQAAAPGADGKMELRPLSPDMYRVEFGGRGASSACQSRSISTPTNSGSRARSLRCTSLAMSLTACR